MKHDHNRGQNRNIEPGFEKKAPTAEQQAPLTALPVQTIVPPEARRHILGLMKAVFRAAC